MFIEKWEFWWFYNEKDMGPLCLQPPKPLRNLSQNVEQPLKPWVPTERYQVEASLNRFRLQLKDTLQAF